MGIIGDNLVDYLPFLFILIIFTCVIPIDYLRYIIMLSFIYALFMAAH